MRSRLILIVVILFKVVTNLVVLFPMSVDVGQGLVPWLMGHGKILYQNLIEHRPPLSAWIIALVQPLLRGDTILTIRLLHLLTVVLMLLLIDAAARKLSKNNATVAVISILYFAGLDSIFNNVLFYYEILIGLFYLAIFYLLAAENQIAVWRIMAAGILLGLCLFIKPQSALAIVIVVLWVFVSSRSWRKTLCFLLAIATPVALIWLLYAVSGLWNDYWFWNFTFNRLYGGGIDSTVNGNFFRQMLLLDGWLFPLALLCWQTFKQDRTLAYRYALLAVMALTSYAFLYPRFGVLYAAPSVPLVSLAAGIVLYEIFKTLRLRTGSNGSISLGLSGVLLVAVAFNVFTSYIPSPAGFGKIIGIDDLRPVATWVRENSNPDDTLYVLPASDSVPQLQILADRLPPETWAIANQFTLAYPPLVERLLNEWNVTPPQWIVYFPSLAIAKIPVSAHSIMDFVQRHYRVVKEFDPIPLYGPVTVYRWGNN